MRHVIPCFYLLHSHRLFSHRVHSHPRPLCRSQLLGVIIIGLVGHVDLHERSTGQHFFLLIVIMMLLLTVSLLLIFLLNLDAVFHTIPFAFLVRNSREMYIAYGAILARLRLAEYP